MNLTPSSSYTALSFACGERCMYLWVVARDWWPSHYEKPGFVDAPMTADIPKNALFATPDKVAVDILRAVARGQDEI